MSTKRLSIFFTTLTQIKDQHTSHIDLIQGTINRKFLMQNQLAILHEMSTCFTCTFVLSSNSLIIDCLTHDIKECSLFENLHFSKLFLSINFTCIPSFKSYPYVLK